MPYSEGEGFVTFRNHLKIVVLAKTELLFTAATGPPPNATAMKKC